MSLYKTFKTDENLEAKGIFLEYGYLTGADGAANTDKPIRIQIARSGGSNKRYAKLLETKTKPFRSQIAAGTMDETIARRVVMEVYAEGIVLGWDNVQDANGNDLPFTRDNVIKVFTDLPELFIDVQKQAGSLALFRESILEEDSKNS